MKISRLDHLDTGDIDRYIQTSGHSTLYHDVRWGSVIERSFGHKSHYLVARGEDGRIKGVLPLVHMKSVMFGNFLVSMPYLNYGGICAESDEAAKFLMEGAERIGDKGRVQYIEYRHERVLSENLPCKTEKVSMRLELPSDPDSLWNSFPSKLRSQIRRPQKEGMQVKIGRMDELENFYHVFSINMRDLGTPVYPKKFFRNILVDFSKNSWIATVYRGEEAVASGFLMGFKQRMEIPWASSLRKYNRFGPNMLLYWSALNFSCEAGYTLFDFGRSSPGGGTYRFKEQWGAKPTQLYWYYWLNEGREMPDITTTNPKYHLAINLWKKLPVALTKLLGPQIVKNIP